jgi:hypothetical protein
MRRYFLVPATRSKWALLWCLLFFTGSQLTLGTYLHRYRPELCDPILGNRLRALRARITRAPGAPLVLILGTSRPLNGLWPAACPLRPTSTGVSPIVFNFAISGSGHVGELVNFHHLLADGIRPDWILIETWPPLWPKSRIFDDKNGVAHFDLGLGDLPTLLRYYPQEYELVKQTLQGSLVPLFSHRSQLLGATATVLLPRVLAWKFMNEQGAWKSPDDTGWIPVPNPPHTEEARQKELEIGRQNIRRLVDPLSIDPRRDQALRQLLTECRAHRIKAALFIMPEHSEVRRWYSPATLIQVNNYLADIGREHQVPVIDTRDWVADEGFSDAAHMERWAAAPFSERFGREVLQPLLEGRHLNSQVLLREAPAP